MLILQLLVVQAYNLGTQIRSFSQPTGESELAVESSMNAIQDRLSDSSVCEALKVGFPSDDMIYLVQLLTSGMLPGAMVALLEKC